jgi:hypothetical protein
MSLQSERLGRGAKFGLRRIERGCSARSHPSGLVSYNARVNKSRLIPLMVIRDETVAAARTATQEFLTSNHDVVEELNRVIFAHHALGNLIPETVETFFSGHAFPYWAAQMELETSVQLAQEAFYTQGFATVRCMLELDLLGVYFDVDDRAHEDVQDCSDLGNGRRACASCSTTSSRSPHSRLLIAAPVCGRTS